MFFFLYATVFRFGTFLINLDEDHFLHKEYNEIYTAFFVILFGIISVSEGNAFAPNYAKARLSAKRIFALVDLVPSIDSFSEEGDKPAKIDGQVSLEKVEFEYPARPNVPVLQGLSLSIKPGQTLALVGPSGCGKSTVVSLMERFYDPLNGNVQIDGIDVKIFNVQWLRYQMGLMSQELVLFDCSIANNIRYGDNFREVSIKEVEAAAKSADIHDFIISLPQGYSSYQCWISWYTTVRRTEAAHRHRSCSSEETKNTITE